LAESGNTDAEYESGRRFIEGRGCEPDIKKGVSFLKRSAES
jgi:TPR repeat protein